MHTLLYVLYCIRYTRCSQNGNQKPISPMHAVLHAVWEMQYSGTL